MCPRKQGLAGRSGRSATPALCVCIMFVCADVGSGMCVVYFCCKCGVTKLIVVYVLHSVLCLFFSICVA